MPEGKYPIHRVVQKLGEISAIKILGYFGSSTNGVVKVYPSLDDLSEYYEIEEPDILHVEDAPAEELPHGGSAIWLRPESRVRHTVGYQTTTEARFLSGSIGSGMAKGPAVAYRSQFRQAFEPATANCEGFSVWPCSVVWGACLQSNDDPCAYTKAYGCQLLSADSCLPTCGGAYTCGGPCYSVACPPSVRYCTGQHLTVCCQIATRAAACPK